MNGFARIYACNWKPVKFLILYRSFELKLVFRVMSKLNEKSAKIRVIRVPINVISVAKSAKKDEKNVNV